MVGNNINGSTAVLNEVVNTNCVLITVAFLLESHIYHCGCCGI